MELENSIEDERPGHCKALFWSNGSVSLCQQPTRRKHFAYCYDCWDELSNTYGETPEFPPFNDDGLESRFCIGSKNIFLLSRGQMQKYTDLQPSRSGPGPMENKALTENQAIFVGPVKMNQAWKYSDARHTGRWTVYVIRLGDGSYYIGQTRKSAQVRFEEHKAGIGAKIVQERGAEKLTFQMECSSRRVAVELEEYSVKLLRRHGLRAEKGNDPDR